MEYDSMQIYINTRPNLETVGIIIVNIMLSFANDDNIITTYEAKTQWRMMTQVVL